MKPQSSNSNSNSNSNSCCCLLLLLLLVLRSLYFKMLSSSSAAATAETTRLMGNIISNARVNATKSVAKKSIDKAVNKVSPTEYKLSEAEMLRNERIKRNDEFLKSLGLNATSTNLNIKKADADTTKRKKEERKKKDRLDDKIEEPIRKSARKAGLQPDFISSAYMNNFNENKTEIKMTKIVYDEFKVDVNPDAETVRRNKITAKMLRELIDNTNKEHSELISDDAITHCVYRITSMSNKALGTRIKMIARAAGQNSYEKLLVFHYALKASGLSDLADSSQNALNHLEGLHTE